MKEIPRKKPPGTKQLETWLKYVAELMKVLSRTTLKKSWKSEGQKCNDHLMLSWGNLPVFRTKEALFYWVSRMANKILDRSSCGELRPRQSSHPHSVHKTRTERAINSDWVDQKHISPLRKEELRMLLWLVSSSTCVRFYIGNLQA